MKRKILLLAALTAVCMLALTGCTSSENTDTQTNTAGSQSASAAQDAGADTAENAGTDTAGTAAGTVSADSSSGDGQSTSGNTAPSGENVTAANALSQPQDASAGDVAAAVISDNDTAVPGDEDIWSGTYVTDSERVTVTQLDEETISFAFAQAGISGTAKVDGSQAVFNGDDYHVVVFSLNGTVLNVAVSSEEDYDTSASPLNGTYIRSES